MSRMFIIASLMTAFTSFASADRLEERFAKPPVGAGAPRRADLRVAPIVVDRARVRAKLASNRAANVARFRAYQAAGVFPSNTYQDGSLNVWLDEDGHLCAAATIIKASGQTALVMTVAEQDNFIKLGDVTQGPLMDWILTSGLTQREIAAIQEPFDVVTPEPGEPSWLEPRTVDNGMRQREDARLRAKYKQVERMITINQRASLDAATDRLMKNPQLAARLIAG